MKNNLAYCESILYTYTEREEEASKAFYSLFFNISFITRHIID